MNENVIIESLLLVPTVVKNKMYQRSSSLQLTQHDLNGISEMMQQSPTGKIGSMQLANVAPNILRVADNISKETRIINGWQTKRLKFLMVTATDRGVRGIFRSYIQGYSDYFEASYTGQIDPNITLYINSIYNTTTTLNPQTNAPATRLVSALNVIFDPLTQNNVLENDLNTMKLMRPLDVVTELSKTRLYEDEYNVNYISNNVGDKPVPSKAGNKVGLEQVTSVLNAVNTGLNSADISFNESDILTNAAGALAEVNLNSIPFISAISKREFVSVATTFQLSALKELDPRLVPTLVEQTNQAVQINEFNTDNFEDLGRIKKEATIATQVVDSGTGIMLEAMLTTCAFSMTNNTVDGNIAHSIIHFNSVIPVANQIMLMERFIDKFKYLVFPTLSEHNQMAVSITVVLDIASDSRVSVSIGNNHPISYTIPTYADSLFTSVVATNAEYDNSIRGYDTLVSLTQH